jgi:hypothetical protein
MRKDIFGVLTIITMNISTVFWDVTSFTLVEVYRSIRENVLFILKMEAACFSETSTNVHQTTQCHISQDITIKLLAKIPGVARDSIRNEGTREINYGIYKNNYNLLRCSPPWKSPGPHCLGGWVGPRTGLDVMEKRNIFPLPGIQPQLSTPMPVETPRTQRW